MTLLLFLLGAAGLYFYLRARSRRRAKVGLDLRVPRDEEERQPLGRETHELEDYHDTGRDRAFQTRSPVFEIGDEDLEDERAVNKRRD
jgi:hypothetical protein